MKPAHACDCWIYMCVCVCVCVCVCIKENPQGFALAHLRRKLTRPGARGKCLKTIVIVGYIWSLM